MKKIKGWAVYDKDYGGIIGAFPEKGQAIRFKYQEFASGSPARSEDDFKIKRVEIHIVAPKKSKKKST